MDGPSGTTTPTRPGPCATGSPDLRATTGTGRRHGRETSSTGVDIRNTSWVRPHRCRPLPPLLFPSTVRRWTRGHTKRGAGGGRLGMDGDLTQHLESKVTRRTDSVQVPTSHCLPVSHSGRGRTGCRNKWFGLVFGLLLLSLYPLKGGRGT